MIFWKSHNLTPISKDMFVNFSVLRIWGIYIYIYIYIYMCVCVCVCVCVCAQRLLRLPEFWCVTPHGLKIKYLR